MIPLVSAADAAMVSPREGCGTDSRLAAVWKPEGWKRDDMLSPVDGGADGGIDW